MIRNDGMGDIMELVVSDKTGDMTKLAIIVENGYLMQIASCVSTTTMDIYSGVFLLAVLDRK